MTKKHKYIGLDVHNDQNQVALVGPAAVDGGPRAHVEERLRNQEAAASFQHRHQRGAAPGGGRHRRLWSSVSRATESASS